jgi:hypothetical protein
MRRVFKYPLPVQDAFTLTMPAGAQFLSVQVQRDQPTLWALIDDRAHTVVRRFMILGTGHGADAVGAYIGTFQLADGAFVGHLFEAPRD